MESTRDEGTQLAGRERQEHRAGIEFPVTRIRRYMQQRAPAHIISTKAAIALASTLEYLCSEVIELAGDECLEEGKGKIIKPRHINLAVKKDEELYGTVGGAVVFATSSVVPYIDPMLVVTKKRKKAKAQN